MADRLTVQVQYLRPGDVLTPTNREVVRCSRGVRTPSGKHDVDLRRAEPEGNDENPVYRSTFGSRTVVTVLRNS